MFLKSFQKDRANKVSALMGESIKKILAAGNERRRF